ncbi:DNA methyltransferase [Halorarius halobius]|uniref:DNA methyltransferase n=1 Tax=Halorarius halobius TaxID=2962671 RepID=UPI0020CD2434|nr:DNA methyltransferase [Halorarius halobius]
MSKTTEGASISTDDLIAENTIGLQSTWKEAPRGWGHSLHRLSPYIGGFPPALAHYFIRRFSDVGDTVLDPFSGGGTTPLEAALHNRKGYGNDIFSYAYTLSKAKCNPVNPENFEEYLDEKLDEAASVDNTGMRLLDNDDLQVFYSDYTLDQILRLREVLYDDDSPKAMYLKAVMCGILHGPSQMFLSLQTKDTYSGTANYVREYAEEHDLELPERDIRPKAIQKHELAQEDFIPPWVNSQTKITQSNATDLPFESETADLIVTSPPYMQTLNYDWNNWIRLWWLNTPREDERDNLVSTQDTDKYREFMRECLWEMYNVLAPDSVAVLIVGDVRKHLSNRKQILNTAAIIAEEAQQYTDFDVHGIIDDAYDVDNRSYVVFNRLKYDHDEDDEERETIDRCLILKKGSPEMSTEPEIDWEKELYKSA